MHDHFGAIELKHGGLQNPRSGKTTIETQGLQNPRLGKTPNQFETGSELMRQSGSTGVTGVALSSLSISMKDRGRIYNLWK